MCSRLSVAQVASLEPSKALRLSTPGQIIKRTSFLQTPLSTVDAAMLLFCKDSYLLRRTSVLWPELGHGEFWRSRAEEGRCGSTPCLFLFNFPDIPAFFSRPNSKNRRCHPPHHAMIVMTSGRLERTLSFGRSAMVCKPGRDPDYMMALLIDSQSASSCVARTKSTKHAVVHRFRTIIASSPRSCIPFG